MMPTQVVRWLAPLLALIAVLGLVTNRPATACVSSVAFFIIVMLWLTADE